MAVRIPQYQQKTSPSGLGASPAARGADLDTSDLRAAQGLAGAVGEAADTYTKVEEAVERKKQLALEEDGKVYAGFAIESARAAQSQWLTDSQNAATDGAPGFTDGFNAQFNEYEKTVLAQAPNDVSRKFLGERLRDLRFNMAEKASAFEEGERVRWQVDKTTQSIDMAISNAASDPTQFKRIVAEQRAVIETLKVTPDKKRELNDKLIKGSAKSIVRVQTEADPNKALQISSALLGISEPTLQVSGGQDIVKSIIRNESAGKMFGKGGEVLRGPAIRTKSGATIYAYGKYQMLESTARETASAAGIPWDQELFFKAKTGDPAVDAKTEQYHDSLGLAYIEKQNAQFGGNPILIAAAHNMGPGATKGWAEGRPYQTQSGAWFRPSKPMDMEALPKETRNYINKLGVVSETAPKAAVQASDDETLPYRLLSPEDLLTARNQAQSRLAEINRQNESKMVVDKSLFNQRLDDLTVAASNGDDIELPSDQELVTYLGEPRAVLAKTKLLGLQQMSGVLKTLPGMSNDELDRYAEMPNPEGTDNRENRQAQRDAIAARARAVLAARAADPGKAALDGSNAVKAAFADWQAKSQEGDPNAANASMRKYLQSSFAQQKQWGILEPKLPNEVADSIADNFKVGLAEGKVDQISNQFKALPKLLKSPDAIKQIINQTGDMGSFAMDGVDPKTLGVLNQALGMKSSDMVKLLPAGIKQDAINVAVRQAFAPLMSSFSSTSIDGSNDSSASVRYLEGGTALASQYLISKRASSAKEAAKMAYDELYAKRGVVIKGLRVPSDFKPQMVEEGLARKVRALSASNIYATRADPGFTLEETKERILRTVQRNGRWVNDEDGDGAYLMYGGVAVSDAAGKPIKIKFSEAQNAPAIPSETAREQARLDSLARGLK